MKSGRLSSANLGLMSSESKPLPYVLETDSTPAATYVSPSPELMAWKAILMVCNEEAQNRLTVVPGTESGRPPSNAAIRPDVEALFVMGQAATEHHVVNGPRIESRNFLHESPDAETGQIVGPDVDQGALIGASDGGAGGGNDHR